MFIILIITGCGKQIFDGSITGNDKRFIMNYSIMNCEKTKDMMLEKGTKINVILENKSGHLDIRITDSDGESIYRGDDATSGKFSIEIPKTDAYKFSVTGKKAKGSVNFKVAEEL